MGWWCIAVSACPSNYRRSGAPPSKRTAQERMHVQGNHSSSFPPSQRMCVGRCQVVVEVMRPRVVFPGRPLRVERRGRVSRAGRSFPKACSLVLDRIPLYCVVEGCREAWFSVPGRRLTGDKGWAASAQGIPFATETWRRVVCWRGIVPAAVAWWVVRVVRLGWREGVQGVGGWWCWQRRRQGRLGWSRRFVESESQASGAMSLASPPSLLHAPPAKGAASRLLLLLLLFLHKRTRNGCTPTRETPETLMRRDRLFVRHGHLIRTPLSAPA